MIKYIIRQKGDDNNGMWFDTKAAAIEYAKVKCRYIRDSYEIFECKLVGTVAIPEPKPEFFPYED